MTPTNPISEAREAYQFILDNAEYRVDGGMSAEMAISRALDYAETQAAEIERLKKDQYVRFTDTMNKLELDNAMMAQRLKAGELEYMRSKEAEITTLKAKLAKAEEVIAPFEKIGTELCANPDAAGYVTIKTQASYFRAAAQFTKGEEV